MKESNFNRIAWCYDGLTKIIFGKSIRKSQTEFLVYCKPEDKVLIVGGGTGWILEDLASMDMNIYITYIEKSSKMIEKAKGIALRCKGLTIDFIIGTEMDIPVNTKFDLVLANYFFDLFTPAKQKFISNLFYQALNRNGLLLTADFYIDKKSPIWQKIVVRIMYLFFKLSTGIETMKLSNYRKYIEQLPFTCIHHRVFYAQFIHSNVYQKIR